MSFWQKVINELNAVPAQDAPAKASFVLPLIFLLLALSINLYPRFFPAYFPQLRDQALSKVKENAIKAKDKLIEEQYPEMNDNAKRNLVSIALKEEEKTKQFAAHVDKEYQRLKRKYQDSEGYTFFLEVDPFQWFRYTQNVLRNGHPGDSIKNGKSYDERMLAPVGTKVIGAQFFFYVSAYIYKAVHFIVKDIKLEHFLFYLSLLYPTLYLILLFFFTRYFFSDIVAFFATLFVGLNSYFVMRSSAGWFDYESFSVGIPLAIVWLIIVALEMHSSTKKLIVYTLAASFLFGVYSFTWIGYWWVFCLIIFFFVWSALNAYSIQRKWNPEIKKYCIAALLFIVSAFVFCFFISRINLLHNMYIHIMDAFNLGTTKTVSVFPNTYFTVSEMKKATLENITQEFGLQFFIISFSMVLIYYLRERRSSKNNFVTLMIFWILIMLFATLKSRRFIVFLSVPFGIFLAAAIDEIISLIKPQRISPRIKIYLFTIFFLALFWTSHMFTYNAVRAARQLHPVLDTSWNAALSYIKEKTPPSAIINAWWDYGNFIKTVAERKVLFDPQSQQRPMAYWMARVFLSSNEDEAVRILRMLNNSSDALFKDITAFVKDDFVAIAILTNVLKSTKDEANALLERHSFPKNLHDKVIDTIFVKEPAPAYIMVTQGMINIMSEVSFLGNWDFAKKYVKQHEKSGKQIVTQGLERVFSYSSQQARQTYQEVSLAMTPNEINEITSKRLFTFSALSKGKIDGEDIFFANGLIVDVKTLRARAFVAGEDGYEEVKYVYLFDGKNYTFKENKGATLSWACLVLKDQDSYRAIALSKGLCDSLFMKLSLLGGNGLKYFDSFYSNSESGMYVYKINWPKVTKEN